MSLCVERSILLKGLSKAKPHFDILRFDTKDIPVDGASLQTKFNVNPSTITLSSTTPIQVGQLNTMISMDFNGENDRPEPRLRVVYGKYINYDLDIGLLAGLARDLRAKGANGSEDSALGWAVSGSAKLGLPFLGAKDNFRFTLHYGDGYGTQLKSGPKEGAFDTGNSELKTIGTFGSYGGIHHFWSDRFRSNLVYGYVNSDNPGFVSGDTFDNTNYIAADLIWTPYQPVTLGVEYLWGRRENKDGASGTDNRYLFSSRYDF